ncbi:MAG: hypothetical protein IJQ62_08650 [Clostridia bacterium]|nr:hypothetical protein [Clostridia bacterium]
MKRVLLLMLALCLAMITLPAAAEKKNLTERGVFKVPAGEIQMFEIGDITVDHGGGIWAKNVNSHSIISVDRISGGDWSIALEAEGGSIIASFDEIITPEGCSAEIDAKDGGFISLTGGNCRSEGNYQGFLIKEAGASAARIHVNEIYAKGKYGILAFPEDSSTLIFSAKKVHCDGEYGVWVQSKMKGNGKETLISVEIGELESPGVALQFQQYGSGYYSDLTFGKVTAGDIALRLEVDGGNVANVFVKEDVTAGRIGVKFYSDQRVQLIVAGTINASEAPILVADMSGRSGVGINGKTQVILAWRIIPTASGHVVMRQGKETDTVVESNSTEALEKAIRYIIRTEESDQAAFTLKKADGEDIRISSGYPVACEGERVLVEVQAADGYRVTSVLNGEEEKTPLEQDENGNWYFDMPRGGGISLFAVTEPAT